MSECTPFLLGLQYLNGKYKQRSEDGPQFPFPGNQQEVAKLHIKLVRLPFIDIFKDFLINRS